MMENNQEKIVYTDEAMESAKLINRKFAVTAACVFVALLLLPSIIWGILSLAAPGLVKKLDFDTGENRNKVQMPETIEISTLTSDLESYYNDRVPFRSVLYSLQKNMENDLEKPYINYIVPSLSKLIYGDQPDNTQAGEVQDSFNNPELDLDSLFGNSDSSDTSSDTSSNTSSDTSSNTSSDVSSDTQSNTSSTQSDSSTAPKDEVEDEGDKNCIHVLGKGTLSKAATCTAFGEKIYKCTKCSYTEKEFLSKVNHSMKLTKEVASTCVKNGEKTYQCTVCDYTEKESVAKSSHQFKLIEEIKATSTKDGEKIYKCTVCDYTKKEIIPKIEVEDEGDKNCSHVLDNGTLSKSATCIAFGEKIYKCTKCDYAEKEYLSKVNHNMKLTKEVAATCTKNGEKTYKCTMCDHTEKETILKTGHQISLSKEVAVTCTTDGEKIYECKNCDYTETETTPKLGHKDKVISTTAATCTKDGSQTVQCTVCKRTETQIAKIAAGHKTYFVRTSLPSYDDYGYDLYKCSACGWQEKRNIKNKFVDNSYLAPVPKGPNANKAIIGRRDWLFYTGDDGQSNINGYQGTNILSATNMANYLNTMKQLQTICNQKGIKLVFAVMPNKEQVYSEYMPTYQIVNSTKRCVIWRDYVKNNSSVPFVYPLEELIAYKQYFQTYYKHDTHWNTAGGFVGLQSIYKAIGLPTTDLRDLVWKETTKRGDQMWADYTVGDLYRIGGLNAANYSDKYYDITYKPEITVKETVKYIGYNATWFTTSDSPNKQKIAVLSDSFKDAMAPFIPKDFASAMITHRSNFGNAEVQNAVKNANVLVIAAVERGDTGIINTAKQCIDLLR